METSTTCHVASVGKAPDREIQVKKMVDRSHNVVTTITPDISCGVVMTKTVDIVDVEASPDVDKENTWDRRHEYNTEKGLDNVQEAPLQRGYTTAKEDGGTGRCINRSYFVST